MLAEYTIPPAPEGFKSGFIAIIGRPNVGKSTLMNQLVGQKIAITSPTAQTTRNRLTGILTTDRAQIIFVDTPGIHKPHHQLGKILVKNARTTINSTDAILLLVDGSVKAGKGDQFVANLLEKIDVPIILGLNKQDLLNPDQAAAIEESYQALNPEGNWPIVKFSALEGAALPELQQLLVDKLSPGPYYYPPELVTDQPERFIMAELIREQILLHTRQEVPHSVAIVIEKIEETPKLTKIMAAINVERSSQKKIIIGNRGSMVKTIGTEARKQIQKLVSGKVYLQIFVKVQSRWRESPHHLSEFGYRLEE